MKHVVDSNVTVRQSMELLNSAKRILFVVQNQKLVGSLSDGDVRRWILKGGSLDEPVSVVMHKRPRTVKAGEEERAKDIIREEEMLAVPVLSENGEIQEIVFWNERDFKKRQHGALTIPVVMMAGGKGERLMPFTSIVPKPLIPIGEKPISELIIDGLREAGCREFYLVLNYKKNMIKAYYNDLIKDYTINFIEEEEELGTGGGLYYLKEKLENTFLLTNCDILLDVDYEDVFRFHKKQNNLITLITSLKRYTVPYGTVSLDNDGQINKMQEKPSVDYLVNTGVYLLEPEVLQRLKNKRFVHMPDVIGEAIADRERVGTYPISEDALMDMGQFENMELMKRKLGV